MHTSINQLLYPDRQAFFEKLALKFSATARNQDRTRTNA